MMDKFENVLLKVKNAIGLKSDPVLSDFQKAKLIHEFHVFIDFNKDGKLQWKDFELARENICKKSGWDENSKERTLCRELFVDLWRNLLDTGDTDHDGQVTIDEWLDLWLRMLRKKEKDEKELSKRAKKRKSGNATDADPAVESEATPNWLDNYIQYKFYLLDRAGDGKIDEEEYEYVLNDFDVDPQQCRNAFRIITQNGSVQLDEEYYKTLSIDFYFSNNPGDLGNFINGKLTYDESKRESKNAEMTLEE